MQEVYRIRGEQVSSSGGFDVVVLQQQDRRGAVGAAQISKAAFLGSASRLVHNLTRTAGIYIYMYAVGVSHLPKLHAKQASLGNGDSQSCVSACLISSMRDD